MEEKLEQLKSIIGEAIDLLHVFYLIEWDQQTNMPPGSAADHGYMQATVQKLAHLKWTSNETGRLIEDLKPYAATLDPDSDDARLVKVVEREHKRKARVPADMVAEKAQLTALAQRAWQEARAEKNFAKFQPYLERIVDWRRRYAVLFAPYDHIYDPQLDEFDPGLKTADVKVIFDELRPQQVALIQAIKDRPQVDASFLYQPYPEQSQWDFGVEVITKFGFDWKHSRQDRAAHPFTTTFGIGDVRITTRFLPEYFSSAFFSTIHENGHAFYDLGIDPALSRTPLSVGISHAMHESQSRLWENLVGRSRPFWQHFYPRLKEYFPSQLGNVSLEAFYKGINKVEPSPIRVEADEATYNLHVMLRMELEIALMEGSLQVRDLPEAWNTRMQEYLGVVPADDGQGVLQDIHWSYGDIGYFPSYTMGNLIAAQLWNCVNEEIPNLTDMIQQGEFDLLREWLREKIHRHGAKFEVKELVQRITGSQIDPAPYIHYLQSKYAEIYGY
jgi:carboxypeptidase Taq